MRLGYLSLATGIFGLGLSAQIAFGLDVVTYQGTLGPTKIIVELTERDDRGRFEGRYADLAKGVDIPLHGVPGDGTLLTINEEAPCDETLCTFGENGPGPAPIAGVWTLSGIKHGALGATLTGQWTDAKSGHVLTVALERKGHRAMGKAEMERGEMEDPETAAPFAVAPLQFDDDIDPADYPYDLIRSQYGNVAGKEEGNRIGRWRHDPDARTGFSFPVLVSLKKGNPKPIETWLLRERLQQETADLGCMASAYLGFGWEPSIPEAIKDYESSSQMAMVFLTRKLVGALQSGSFFCGGAHPNNFERFVLGDAKTGKAIVPETLVKGFHPVDYNNEPVNAATAEPYSFHYVPDDHLATMIINRGKAHAFEMPEDCKTEDHIRGSLGVALAGDDLQFVLYDLPGYVMACSGVLVTIPIKDARKLLTPSGKAYLLH